MGAFASGFGMGQRAYQQGIDNDRQKVLDGYKADEMARLKVMQGREDERFAAEDAAFANFSNVRSGISPEQQGQIQQTYGMTPQQTARSGTGLQAKLASYDAPDSYDMQDAPAPGGAAGFNAQGLKLTPPSRIDLEAAMGGISAAKRDVAGMRASQDNQYKLTTDEGRKAEFARLSAMKPEELSAHAGAEFSRDGSGIDAMLTYDKANNQYLFASNVPGMPSQTLSRVELINQSMGIWESGNGDFAAGMKTQLDTVRAQREVSTKNEARAATLATGNAGLTFKGREADVADRKAATDESYKNGMLGIYGDRVDVSREKAAAGAKSSRPQVTLTKNDDGTYLATSKADGSPVYYMTSEGQKLPIGMSGTQFSKLQKLAGDKKVQMVEGFSAEGTFMYGYVGADGETYPDPQQASLAKPSAKQLPGAAPSANASERQMRKTAGLSTDEAARSAAFESSAANLAELDAEIKRQKNPEALAALRAERQRVVGQQGASALPPRKTVATASESSQNSPSGSPPSPPPETLQRGLTLSRNPAYATWEAQYSPAYRAMQAEAQAQALRAKSDYNPYAQNRVR